MSVDVSTKAEPTHLWGNRVRSVRPEDQHGGGDAAPARRRAEVRFCRDRFSATGDQGNRGIRGAEG